MRVLLVEDEDPKLNSVTAFVRERYPEWDLHIARSVRSATDSLRVSAFDLLLLDMSLPTFDIGHGEPGGRPQGFGGMEVLRYIEMMDLDNNVIVITGYEGFTKEGRSIDLSALGSELQEEFPRNFRGAVQFNSVSGEWVNELARLLDGLGSI